jgi:hypothetical protein
MDFDDALWNGQIEADVEAGKFDAIIDEVRTDLEAGCVKPL